MALATTTTLITNATDTTIAALTVAPVIVDAIGIVHRIVTVTVAVHAIAIGVHLQDMTTVAVAAIS